MLSQKLVDLRRRKGWNQLELARAAGIPQPTICRLESGDIEQPKLVTITKIAKALEVSIDYLASGEYVIKPHIAIAIKPRVVIEEKGDEK